MAIQAERMVGDLETFGAGNVLLAAFNFSVKELLNPAAIEAHQMVVVLAFVELVDRFAAFKLAAGQQTGLLELHQHAVDGGQANVGAFVQDQAVHILGAHVALAAFVEQLQDRQSRQGGFEASVFQISMGEHARLSRPRDCR